MLGIFSKTGPWLGLACYCFAACSGLANAEDRTYDGSGNNLANPTWGMAGTRLVRLTPADYSDGISAPAGADRPSTRDVSNGVFGQDRMMPNHRGLSSWVYQWGQFLDHDIDLTPNATPREPFPIAVPKGDPFFDAAATGTVSIPLNRSLYDRTTGTDTNNPREQINVISSYIDGSMVYGSDATRAAALRTGTGGRLKESGQGLLPYNTLGLPNDTAGNPQAELFFVAGDVRANENISLTAVHTLFSREHNYWADQLSSQNPGWTDEQVYQRARRIVGAEIQAITYEEFLPALLGDAPQPTVMPAYDPTLNAAIANEFSTGFYRLGHTMVNPRIARVTNDGAEAPGGSLPLRDSFFVPQSIGSSLEVDYLLKGLASEPQQEVDTRIVNALRNSLLGDAPSGLRLDLAAINTQRGRDHGLMSYVDARAALNLSPVTTFAEITSDVALAQALEAVYGTVDKVDLYVGQLAEDHLPGASVGPLLDAGLRWQFDRLRSGDRFYYEFDSAFTEEEQAAIKQTRLAEIIRRNTGITNLQENVFFAVPEPGLLGAGLLAAVACHVMLVRRRTA